MFFDKISPENNNDSSINNTKKEMTEQDKEIMSRREFLKKTAITATALFIGTEAYKNKKVLKNLYDSIKSNKLADKNKLIGNNDLSGEMSNVNSEVKEEYLVREIDDIAVPEEEQTPMRQLAISVLESYHEIYQEKDFLPRDIFSKNFLIATQLQESRYNADAESEMGAVGVMQTMPVTIKDVIRCLDIFKRKGIVSGSDYKMEDLSDNDIEELKLLIKANANYGRAFGKIYFASLFKIYKVGKKEYKKNGAKAAQKKLLAAYNGGLRTRRKTEKSWPKETRQYCDKIFTFMEYLERFQEEIKKEGIKSNNNYLSMVLVKEMTSYNKIDASSQLFDDLLNNFISEIKLAENARYRELSDLEIKNIIKKLHSKSIRFYLTQINSKKAG